MTRALEIVAGIHRRTPFGVALTLERAAPETLDALAVLDARATFFLDADDVDRSTIARLRAAGHGIGWRTEAAHEALVRLDGRIVRLHRPEVPTSITAAIELRRRRLDPWLWSIDESMLEQVRDRDVVRVVDDIERAVAMVRARDLDLVAL